MSDIYVENGYNNRVEYLKALADDFQVDFLIVKELAMTLGKSEDFDLLVSTLEDMAEENQENEIEDVEYILNFYG